MTDADDEAYGEQLLRKALQGTPAPAAPPQSDDEAYGEQLLRRSLQPSAPTPQAPPSVSPQPSPDGPPSPPPPPVATAAPEMGLEGFGTLPPSAEPAMRRIGQAAISGYRDSPSLVTPAVTDYLNRAPLGRYVYNPLLAAGGAVAGGLNALGGGMMQAAHEAGEAIDPRLGRDLPMWAQVLGAAELGRPGGFGARALERGTMGDAEAPAPPPAGQTPAQAAGIPPGQEASYRRMMWGDKLLEAQPTGPDHTPYIPGAPANEAERLQTVASGQELKNARLQSQTVDQEYRDKETANNAARVAHYNAISGDDAAITDEQKKMEADITADKQALFPPNRPPVDLQPVVSRIDAMANNPENRQNDALQHYLADIRGRLVDADGNPRITDQLEAWGLRRQIDQWGSGQFNPNKPPTSSIQGMLGQIGGAVDGQIQAVNPGYQGMLATYAGHKANIGLMTAMQQAKPGLLNAANQMTYNPVQKLMGRIVQGVDQRAATPSPFAPLANDPDRMSALWALRDDLRRRNRAAELAQGPGRSDTAQNLLGLARTVVKNVGVEGAAHVLAAHLDPGGFGNALVAMGTPVWRGLQAGQASSRLTARGLEMLNPPAPGAPLPPASPAWTAGVGAANALTRAPLALAPMTAQGPDNPLTGAAAVPQGGPQP
jgi:hypothetical protein